MKRLYALLAFFLASLAVGLYVPWVLIIPGVMLVVAVTAIIIWYTQTR